jgi:putative thiamine transport system ATP-binding protein
MTAVPPMHGDAGGALHLAGVHIDVGPRRLIDGLDLTVHAGACITVMGPSGSGKSTLLAHVAGTLGPPFRASGRCFIGGDDITDLAPHRRRLGIQFQDDLLFPHLSVAGNLAFALPARIRGRDARRAAIERALGEAGLDGFADRDPATLSGGQRARVALMRTLLAEPRALLLDEPFGQLDAALRGEIRRFVFAHAAQRRLPTLLVTHDESDAQAAGGPVVSLAAPDRAASNEGCGRRRGAG